MSRCPTCQHHFLLYCIGLTRCLLYPPNSLDTQLQQSSARAARIAGTLLVGAQTKRKERTILQTLIEFRKTLCTYGFHRKHQSK